MGQKAAPVGFLRFAGGVTLPVMGCQTWPHTKHAELVVQVDSDTQKVLEAYDPICRLTLLAHPQMELHLRLTSIICWERISFSSMLAICSLDIEGFSDVPQAGTSH